jgi:hypothetical protein
MNIDEHRNLEHHITWIEPFAQSVGGARIKSFVQSMGGARIESFAQSVGGARIEPFTQSVGALAYYTIII